MHAIDVTNSVGFFLHNGFEDLLTKFETACIIVSSLCHDVGHLGVNNGFLIETRSKEAMIYND
jgi:hypothetical protein